MSRWRLLVCAWAGFSLLVTCAEADDGSALRAESARLIVSGEADKAVRAAQRAVAYDERVHGGKAAETAASLQQLSQAQAVAGALSDAIASAHKALAIREETLGDGHLETATSLNELGVLYLQLGNAEAAEALLERALAIRQERLSASDPLVAESLANAGAVQFALRHLDVARTRLEAALRIEETLYDKCAPALIETNASLAAVFLALQNDPGRRRTQREADSERANVHSKYGTDCSDGPALATALINKAWDLWARDPATIGQVRELLGRAVDIRRAAFGATHPDTAEAVGTAALFEAAAGDHRGAVQDLQRALEVDDALLAALASSGEFDDSPELGRIAAHRGIRYLQLLSLVHQHLRTDTEAVRSAFENVLRRKGLILGERRVSGAWFANDPAALDAWRTLSRRRADLARLLRQGPPTSVDGLENYKEAFAGAQKDIQAAEAALAATSRAAANLRDEGRATAAMVANKLPADAALIEFVRIADWDSARVRPQHDKSGERRERYLAFVLQPDGNVALVDLGDAKSVDDAVRTARKVITGGTAFPADKGEAALRELFARTLSPTRPFWTDSARLIVSPDAQLNVAPLAAARTDQGQFLIEAHEVALVNSGRELLREAPRERSPGVLLLADPRFDAGLAGGSARPADAGGDRANTLRMRLADVRWTSLPGTASEADAIETLTTGSKRVLRGAEATEGNLKRAVREERPGVVYLATHGFFFPPTVRAVGASSGSSRSSAMALPAAAPENALELAGLALTGADHARECEGRDGLLCASEVEGELDLHGTDLVVLSACDTAMGEHVGTEGVYGLRRAFVVAGARNVVMSLWPVSDKATVELMRRFYAGYMAGASPARAMRQAQLEALADLQKENPTRAPSSLVKLWAPFVVLQTVATR